MTLTRRDMLKASTAVAASGLFAPTATPRTLARRIVSRRTDGSPA